MKRKFFCMMLVSLFVFLASFSFNAKAEGQYDINNVKDGFMLLYDSEWRLFNLNYRLFSIIDKEFEIYTNSMMFGTSSFQLALNVNNIIEKIQSDVFMKFSPIYEEFLKSFQSKYYRLLQTNPKKYSIEKIKQAPSYEIIENLQHDGEKKMLRDISSTFDVTLKNKISTPFYSAMWFIAGVLIIMFKGLFTQSLDRKSAKKVRVILALLGFIVLSFGTFQISRGLFFTQGLTRNFINEQTKFLYTSQLPDTYWNILETYVQGAMN